MKSIKSDNENELHGSAILDHLGSNLYVEVIENLERSRLLTAIYEDDLGLFAFRVRLNTDSIFVSIIDC